MHHLIRPNTLHILADATLPGLSALFPSPFRLTYYHNQDEVHDLLINQDILICRSTLRVNDELLHDSTLQCVATASSGTDHIDDHYLNKHHIHLMDAKGSNARAVSDYIVATLAALHQLGKLTGKLAGVIGVGEVGSQVVTRLSAAGFDVICFDPLKAMENHNHHYCSMADLTACDVICVHANLHESIPFASKHLLNANVFARLKKDVIIINAARGGIINEEDLLAKPWPIIYCTDVYSNEPAIDPRIVNFATVCTPHIAGHSIEAKIAAIAQISQQLHDYYGLTMPDAPQNIALLLAQKNQSTWQEYILNRYNPLFETQALKAAINKENAFLTQRKAHLNRHDFNCYTANDLDQQTKLLLGY